MARHFLAVETYFVKDGNVNGVEGERAMPAGDGNDPVQEDGWYWLMDGMDDGVGPFDSEISAMENCKQHVEEALADLMTGAM